MVILDSPAPKEEQPRDTLKTTNLEWISIIYTLRRMGNWILII
jgi:hypothetical protein